MLPTPPSWTSPASFEVQVALALIGLTDTEVGSRRSALLLPIVLSTCRDCVPTYPICSDWEGDNSCWIVEIFLLNVRNVREVLVTAR